MADSLLRQVALLTESRHVSHSDLTKVSAALQKQVVRDVAQFWQVQATVDAFQRLEDVPIGYWPIIVMDDIGFDAAGIHLDDNNQPFALVTASDDMDVWSLTTSHELIEMLLDPFGSRLVAGDSPKTDQQRVQFLLEACDPPESAQYAYTVNGILVSDFYTIRFFDPVVAPGVRYSFTGAIQAPREVLSGGYLSWLDVASNMWWQETWFSGSKPTFRNLGHLDARNGSFRSQIDRLTFRDTTQAVAAGIGAAKAAGLSVTTMNEVTTARAASLRAQIRSITAGSAEVVRRAEAQEPAGPMELAGGRRSGGRRGTSGDGPALIEGLRSAPCVSFERGTSH
jgi:hypothetical protein